jgi:hypothetical protein
VALADWVGLFGRLARLVLGDLVGVPGRSTRMFPGDWVGVAVRMAPANWVGMPGRLTQMALGDLVGVLERRRGARRTGWLWPIGLGCLGLSPDFCQADLLSLRENFHRLPGTIPMWITWLWYSFSLLWSLDIIGT